MATVESFLEEAMELSAEDRVAIGSQLLSGLDDLQQRHDAAWKDEVLRRIASVQNGEVLPLSEEELDALLAQDDD